MSSGRRRDAAVASISPGSAASRSKATDVERSMKNSIHRIWSGISTWRSTMKIVEMRMKPRNATWVETMNTRPFWTLSTMRRPSAQPEHQRRERVVAQHEIGGLAGDRCAAAHRHGDIGAMEGRCVVHAVARSRRRSVRVRARPDEAFASARGVERATTCSSASSAASRASSQAASSSPVTTRSASRPASRAIAAAVSRVVAR